MTPSDESMKDCPHIWEPFSVDNFLKKTLPDLIRQAETEKSHFYSAGVLKDTLQIIHILKAQVKHLSSENSALSVSLGRYDWTEDKKIKQIEDLKAQVKEKDREIDTVRDLIRAIGLTSAKRLEEIESLKTKLSKAREALIAIRSQNSQVFHWKDCIEKAREVLEKLGGERE